MKLYVALDCESCKRVLQEIEGAADVSLVLIKPRTSLQQNAKVSYPVKDEIVNELPSIPALIDGDNVVVGDAILKYLAQNPRTSSFLIKHGV